MIERTPQSQPSNFSEDILHYFNGSPPKVAADQAITKKSTPKELLSILTARLGKEWVLWEPEALWAEVKRAFGSLPGEMTRNRIQAAKVLLVTEAFWLDHLVFEKVVMAFNNQMPMFDRYQKPSAAMIALGIRLAREIRDVDFSDDVRRYIAVIAKDDGLIYLPPPIDVAQDHLDELTAGAAGRVHQEEIGKGWAQGPKGPYGEGPVGIHLAKLRAIQEYAGL